MQSIEIDPELNRQALAEAAQQYPEFAENAVGVIARPFSKDSRGNSSGKPHRHPGKKPGNFKIPAIRAYKRLAGIQD